MTRDKLTRLIEKSQSHVEDETRDYIGASSIGSDCLRKIWYEFKGTEAQEVPTKMRRTWTIGKTLEGLVIEWLTVAGLYIENYEDTIFSSRIPQFKGHVDGLINIGDTTIVLEIKTAKDASFKIFVRDGLKVWNPQYYAQIQSYMGMLGVFSAYILVLNKDNSDLSDELITFDADYYHQLEEKALMISNAVIPPPRINSSPLWFQCKQCKYNKVCHE